MSNFDDKFDQPSLDGVAIIGLSGRFPGSKNVQEFWENLKNGVESISTFTDEELQHLDPALVNDPQYVKRGGVFEDKGLFDAGFFDFTPREAEITDPQQRLLLECAYEALEVAGYHTQASHNRIGVFAGNTSTGYVNNVLSHPNIVQSLGELQVSIGSGHDFLATRIAYKLNLNGPAMTVQTACSTSLVAVHQACQSLLMLECDMALAGGASLRENH
ncbi:MAG: beta-ketoacyl synthase N-terminal-like domain-containing protein, partial [Tumebacillaceae bacterium]